MKTNVKDITGNQQRVLRLINEFTQRHGYSPTLRDIAALMSENTNKNASISLAQYYVKELHMKGYLRKKENKQRGLTPINPDNRVPLLGYIAAGTPIEPIENPEIITVPPSIPLDKRYQYYALTIRGDSMIDMGVLDGDVILVKHQLTAQDGDVVVAVTENGATLKVLRSRNGSNYLEPRNKNYQNIYPAQLEIRGKFSGLIRKK